MKKKLSTIFILIVLFVGLSLLLYPSLGDYINNLNQNRDITRYVENVAKIDKKQYNKILNKAKKYNSDLAKAPTHWKLSDAEIKLYEETLDISGTGIMGYVEIPKINCSLPIYHGTDANVLQIAIGHLEGSSLPIGGRGSHSILSGHRGLPSARLFTDIDKLNEGDSFIVRVLDETLTYEVDQIRVVEPHETADLERVEDQDLCTLVTCTPYGVNTHRLLVRGHRVKNTKKSSEVRVTADALQIDPVMVAPVIAFPMLVFLIIFVLFYGRNKSKKNR